MAAPTNAAKREKSSCQPGAVHTWHISDMPTPAENVRRWRQTGSDRRTVKPPRMTRNGRRRYSPFRHANDTHRVDDALAWRNDVPYVFLNTFKSAERSRLDAAHELAHLILHKHGGPQQGRDAEIEANSFASSFLMPKADVRSRLPFVSRLDELVVAKKRWGVSTAALAYRLHKLGILSDWQYRTFCIQINQKGYRTEEPNGLPREESVIWKKVLRSFGPTAFQKAKSPPICTCRRTN